MRNPLYSMIIGLVCSTAYASWPGVFITDSHLVTFTAAQVANQFDTGANTVEVDIGDLTDPELGGAILTLATRPNDFLILHFTGASPSLYSGIAALLNTYQVYQNQFLVYSSDAGLNKMIADGFPNVYVTRSTGADVLQCLLDGLTDDTAFQQDCLNADLWFPYSTLQTPTGRSNVQQLIAKIRAAEAPGAARTHIAFDAVATPADYCDVYKNFAGQLDGVISETWSAIYPYVNSPQTCAGL